MLSTETVRRSLLRNLAIVWAEKVLPVPEKIDRFNEFLRLNRKSLKPVPLPSRFTQKAERNKERLLPQR